MAGYQDTFRRVEKKYLLSGAQYEALRQALSAHMEQDSFGLHTISNLYFDTPDYSLIRRSLEKPVYKEKLRLRGYGAPGSSDDVYLEIKKKFKGVVYKRRVQLKLCQAERFMRGCALSGDMLSSRGATQLQIAHEINWFERTHAALPMAYIAYDRIALFSPADPALRITFDSGIRWRCDRLHLGAASDGLHLLGADERLMEIKIPGALPLWLSHELTRNDVFPCSFSKYGACYERFILPESLQKTAKEGHKIA